MSLTRRHLLTLTAAGLVARPSFAQDRISVVASTGMIADAARRVGGDLVEVRALMGPGVDPHSYRQTRSDIVAMTRADLVLWHGLYLEAQMEEFLLKLGRRRNVVAVQRQV
jgi:manganese/zinc/iron transport system substrate-binding protein